MPFVEALRQLQLQCRREDFCLIHVSMVPMVGENGEQKTKPTQHSVKGQNNRFTVEAFNLQSWHYFYHMFAND